MRNRRVAPFGLSLIHPLGIRIVKRLVFALTIGVMLTAILFAIACVTAGSIVSKIAFWQGWLLQSLVPTVNIGTLEHPFFEATPLHFLAFFAGLPVGVVIYTAVAYVLLRILPNLSSQRAAARPLS